MTITVHNPLDDPSPAATRAGRRRAQSAAGSAQLPRWQFRFALRTVLIGELAALTAVATLAATAWWALIAVVVAVLVISTLTYQGAAASRWARRAYAARRTRRSLRRRAHYAYIPAPFSVDLPGVGAIGMRWDGHYAITLITLYGRQYSESVLIPEGVDTRDRVPLQAIGELLEQFGGLELHSIDVVSDGTRTAPNGRFTPRYDEIISDRSAVGMRRTWLVLRLRPQACLDAISYRGSVAQAAAAATERIRQAAARQGCRALTCNPEQITEATQALLDYQGLDSYEQRWTDLRLGDDYVSLYRIAGAELSTRALNDFWTIRAKKTVVVLRLTRDQDTRQLMVAALLRVHTTKPQHHPPMSTLHSVAGEAFSAMLASLPLGDRSVQVQLSPRPLASAALQVPVGPSGFLHGMAERAGVPFLMSWIDPQKFIRVAIAADVDVVASLILRASAAGATAEIHTGRPQLWQPICDDVRISLGREGKRSDDVTLVVADGAEAQQALAASGARGHALVSVTAAGQSMPQDADIMIKQVSPHHISVQTPVRNSSITLGIMRPRNEAQSLAHLRIEGPQQ
ncbi:type VII secretion protein EccE [Mycobacterium riyadhense]|uniref:ESX-1 secretion system protein EccE1 n=1 Tax=Mycobacterium riyadhense TaxID=486698 RepID=A0A653ETQ8_9MYCO|nr:type VII secretion protein EccE [Mycobacterium riyadhense]VTP00975.1 ESX-1 secretion system protein EccE1 [Mycobacterium riyadhense]